MLDLFCGTASMALACQEYGVQYLGMDIEERLIAPARARLASFVMYRKMLGMGTAPLNLGTEPTGPREQDPIAGLITLTNAAQVPNHNLPGSNTSSDSSFAIYGTLEDDANVSPVHTLKCACNVDSTTMVIEELDEKCGRLLVKQSVLKVSPTSKLCVPVCFFA